MHVVLVTHRQRCIGLRHHTSVAPSEEVIHRRIGLFCFGQERSYRQTPDGINTIRRSRRVYFQCRIQSGFYCLELRFTCPNGDIIRYTAHYVLLEESPSLVSGEVHTSLEPVGILHVSIDTGDESRLFEVRSVGSGIDTVDKGIVVSAYLRPHVGVVFYFISIGILLGDHRSASRILPFSVFFAGEQVSIRGRFHTSWSVGLTVRAEIETFYLVTLCAELHEFGNHVGMEDRVAVGMGFIQRIIFAEKPFVSIPFCTVVVEHTGAGGFVVGVEGSARGRKYFSVFVIPTLCAFI